MKRHSGSHVRVLHAFSMTWLCLTSPKRYFGTATSDDVRSTAMHGVLSATLAIMLLAANLLRVLPAAYPRGGGEVSLVHTGGRALVLPRVLLSAVIGYLVAAVFLLLVLRAVKLKRDVRRELLAYSCSLVPTLLAMVPPYLGILLAGTLQFRILRQGLARADSISVGPSSSVAFATCALLYSFYVVPFALVIIWAMG